MEPISQRVRTVRRYHLQVKEIIQRDPSAIRIIEAAASELQRLIEELDPLIQRYTSEVCPECRNVCCIDKHAYYEYDDLIYIVALGAELPAYKRMLRDGEPCQFLGESGCSVRRPFRPYRCTWYFCSPLLELAQNDTARHYRRFIDSLRRLTQKREELLNVFAGIAQLGEMRPGYEHMS